MPHVLDIGLSSPVPVAFDGFRAVVSALDESATKIRGRLLGATPVEAQVLMPAWESADARPLSDLALSPSERRLHRESEQVFRVLDAAARAIADTLVEEDVELRLHDIGAFDVPSLRGLLRLVEHLTWRDGLRRLRLSGPTARSGLAAALAERGTPSPEAALLARRLPGLIADETAPSGAVSRVAPVASPEADLLRSVLDDGGSPVDRIAFAVESIRRGFFRADHEVMARCALVGLELATPGLPLDGTVIEEALVRTGTGSPLADAVEFEVGLLRGPADARAFFRKVLGMVHSFRGDNPQALEAFSRIVEDDAHSVELRAQAALYAALTKVKMLRDPAAGIQQAEEGMELLRRHTTGSSQERREGAWLHNVRALCFFSQGKLREALADEKEALARVADGSDSSSVHLKINLISNISVLQERAGRLDGALATWQKYTSVGSAWGPMFTKHHAYRHGGLALAAGRPEEGLTALETAHEAGVSLSDTFHRAVIATELGGLLRESAPERAAHWYTAAARASEELADPYGHALALAGRSLAEGRTPPAALAETAASSVTRPAAGADLAAAITAGDRERLGSLLPKPRTKLNRPFDHVNLT
ncbi:tetratricopeptide repeat protein [Streptomyces xanthophaeus]|uniref:tetratricopeptide repeat protein n=1 Tax=Streptomyces xanthophaeus TaxID=67385 RepID=UPI00371AB2B7